MLPDVMRAAREERLRRERRYYTADMLGRPCPFCKLRVPKALIAIGQHAHPTCGPSEAPLTR